MLMTDYRQIPGNARTVPATGTASLCPIAPACVLVCVCAAVLGGLAAFYSWQAGPLWSVVAGLVTGQAAFGLACLRVCLKGTYTMPGRLDEIEADLAACRECGVDASSR
ncbi:hypothetical protein [Pseudogemmobacter humi]|uniref:Uncharacterized protein n=1 Tax=Pseudogemmobacter humi TaxID=2483812 RepID=A0A3P5WFU9_9RHOB|nr:hypothetical protein [Pseudogemmobacter humi]VDC20185.1 hypothetical protein XINFAN_00362 [Pseudogemmobacter humi]